MSVCWGFPWVFHLLFIWVKRNFLCLQKFWRTKIFHNFIFFNWAFDVNEGICFSEEKWAWEKLMKSNLNLWKCLEEIFHFLGIFWNLGIWILWQNLWEIFFNVKIFWFYIDSKYCDEKFVKNFENCENFAKIKAFQKVLW